MDWLADPGIWIGFLTLVVMEIVLGIDNVIFISIVAGRLPPEERGKATRIGLLLAMGTRILLLLSIKWLVGLTGVLFTLAGHGFSGRDLILIAGGLFLLAKSTHEIHAKLEGADPHTTASVRAANLRAVLVQILLIDVVFSFDSVITAVGMVDEIWVMVAAVVVSVIVMMVAAHPVNQFVERHPTVKMLALSFLLLIGVTLIADGFGQHISKAYVYSAMAFSMFVELLNLRAAKKGAPVKLHGPEEASAPGP